MPKLSSFTAAANLVGASIPVVQGGENRIAPVSVFDTRFGVYQSAADPTSGDDAADGFAVGQRWLNTTTLNEFLCVQATAGAAIWRHIPRILAQSAVAVSVSATTNEEVLVTVDVPAGALGVNGSLRVMSEWSMTDSANNKVFRVRFGADGAGLSGTSYLSSTITTQDGLADLKKITNRGSVSSQYGMNTSGYFGVGGTTGQTSSVNTAAQSEIVFSGQKASAGETITLESYSVELLRPDIS
jgi:hypothetical protein